MPTRFPLRTQLLMLLALAAFFRLWCVTHANRPRVHVIPVTPLPIDGGQ